MRRTHTPDDATTPSRLTAAASSAEIFPDAEHTVMSVEECRRYLTGIELSDEEVKRVRDAIFALVRKVFDEVVPW